MRFVILQKIRTQIRKPHTGTNGADNTTPKTIPPHGNAQSTVLRAHRQCAKTHPYTYPTTQRDFTYKPTHLQSAEQEKSFKKTKKATNSY